MGYEIQKGQTKRNLEFFLVQSADHRSALTGANPTVTIKRPGDSSFNAPVGAIVEDGNGFYYVTGNATDSANGPGVLKLKATAANADEYEDFYMVVNHDPDDLPTTAGIAAAVWAVLTSTLTGAGTIGKWILDKLDDQVSKITGKLPSGNLASSAEVTAIQNNTLAVRNVPSVLELPESGTYSVPITIYLYDEHGSMAAPDSAPTIHVGLSAGGTERDGNLSSTTMTFVSTGKYSVTYTAHSTDAREDLCFEFTVIVGGATRKYGNICQAVDTVAIDFTATDRTNLNTILAKVPDNAHYTNARGDLLSNLDVAVSSRAAAIDISNAIAAVVDRQDAMDILDTSTNPITVKRIKKGTGTFANRYLNGTILRTFTPRDSGFNAFILATLGKQPVASQTD